MPSSTRDDADARYAFYDSGTAARGMTLRELKALPDDTTIFHFGSMALAAEPAASTLIARAKAARGDNRLVSIDPNVRPAIAPGAPDYRRNIEQAMEIADIVKLSRTPIWIGCGQGLRQASLLGSGSRRAQPLLSSRAEPMVHWFSWSSTRATCPPWP